MGEEAKKGARILSPRSGVRLDVLELVLGQRAGLVQDVFPGPDLPDVVQLPAQANVLQRLVGEAELAPRS